MNMKKITFAVLACLLAVTGLLGLVGANRASAAITFANPAMATVWNRTDLAVAEFKASRTWLWGPENFDTRMEPYAQSPGGMRLVSYFDKSRMEINNPNGDRASQWFVTNGLLTKELVTGQLQTGDAAFESRSPAEIPVAGDPDDTGGPTYAALAKVLASATPTTGPVTGTIDRAGNVGQDMSMSNMTSYAYFVPETQHNIAKVFWDFLNSNGLVFENGAFVQGKLFDPTFFATGFPITEAYWAQVKVGGKVQPVLIQAFERRVMTFTPGNQAGWQVEMGNIGRHYFTWRYGTPVPNPTPTATRTATPSPTATPTATPGPTTAQISIINLSFQPATITIRAGDSVTWTNNDSTTHTSASDSGVWDSGFLNPGQSFTRQFTTAGTFPFHCNIHTFMHGTIIVQP
jgi:plastocyanin